MEKLTRKQNTILAVEHKEPYWIPAGGKDIVTVFCSAFKDRYQGTPEHPVGVDDFGVEYTYSPEINAPMPLEKHLVLTDIEHWREQVVFPDPEKMDWVGCAARDLAGVDTENCFINIRLSRNQFERLQSLMGFENTLIALYEEPEFVEEFLDAFEEWRLKIIDKLAEYYHPDSIIFHDDYASADRLFMSPDYWRKTFKPHMQALVDRTHSHGIYAFLHCCGKMDALFPDFVETGADAVQIQALNDIPRLKREYGDRITFLGGLDNIRVFDRPGATEEEMTAEACRFFRETAAGGSYVMMQVFFTPLANEVVARELENINLPLREKYAR